jgi:uncharacterized coiled-coil protein SlyX
MNKLMLVIVLLALTMVVYSQNDIQGWQAKVNQVTSKQVEKLTPDDISFLKSVINMNSERFGSNFQRIVDDKKSDAKSVLMKYEAWFAEKQRKEELDAELGTEKIKTAAQQEVIEAQGDTIVEQKQVIERLNAELARLKSEMKKLNRTNDKLKDENSNLEQIMVDNQKIVERMRVMLSGNSQLKANAPAELKAELEGAECEIAEVMKQNYILTIEKLKKDTEYLDRIQKEYEDTKVYPADFNGYITTGEALATRFKGSEVPCVNQKAGDILSAIDELKMLIEKKDGFFGSIAKFFVSNLLITGLIVLLIIGIVIFLLLRKK